MVLRPLEHGADIVMHSATKYLAGHSDLLMGVLVTDQPELRARLRGRRDLTGALPGALESYLALRGVRTLALRMERAQDNAMGSRRGWPPTRRSRGCATQGWPTTRDTSGQPACRTASAR